MYIANFSTYKITAEREIYLGVDYWDKCPNCVNLRKYPNCPESKMLNIYMFS